MRRHTVEEIRDVWLKNRSADGSDWEMALTAVYCLALTTAATEVEKTECLCGALYACGEFKGSGGVSAIGDEDLWYLSQVDIHDPRCPKSLAQILRECCSPT